MIATRVTIKEEEEEVTTKPQPTPLILPPPMTTTEPAQYPSECLSHRTLSLATMWEMGDNGEVGGGNIEF